MLLALGILIALRGVSPGDHQPGPIPWRGLLILLPTPVIFGLGIRALGLVPSIAIAAFISCFASRRATLPFALALTVGLTIFCVAVFHFALGLPIRLFGTWLDPLSRMVE
jgi:hypothetical protein